MQRRSRHEPVPIAWARHRECSSERIFADLASQIKTPLRTFILKARHEVDAEVRRARPSTPVSCADAAVFVHVRCSCVCIERRRFSVRISVCVPQEWMGHICAAQQGVPVDQRESKLRGYDVYNDVRALFTI